MNFTNEQYSIILPARIVAYYPDTQTADVLVCVERVAHNSEETDTLELRSSILGVPVHTPSGGGWAITMPIAAGDSCLMLFSQVGYDHWFYEDKDSAGKLAGLPKPHLGRRFKEDDGFCFVGINTLPRAIPSYDGTNSQWRGPDPVKQVISLNDDESIEITSNVSLTINAPAVTVNCQTAEVVASTGIDLTAPITAISGDATIGGTLEVTGPVTNLATVTTTGLTTTGGIAVAGGAAADMGSGAMTSTGSISVNGIDLENHTHTITGGSSAGETSTAN